MDDRDATQDARPVVLLVEDDPEIVRFIVRTLSDRYRFVVADDGEEGMALASKMSPEAILTDVMMPRMNGEAFVRKIRSEPSLASVPLAIITAQADEELRLRLLRQGVQDYLLKPFSITELSVRLENLIRRRRAEEALWRLTLELEGRVAERTRALEESNRELRKEVAERCEAEARLKASLSEKETLLKEVNHRVKNNLQLVYSLLNLQTRRVKDPNTLAGLEDCRHRVLAMALVHEKLHRSRDAGRISAPEYFRDLTRHLLDSFGAAAREVTLELQVAPAALQVEEAIPAGLMAYELVSNSLKHAFPPGAGGRVRVGLSREEGGRLALLVEDDGAGLPPDLDVRDADSLGLRLVRTLAEQMKGSLEALKPARGAAFRVTFGPASTPANDLKETLI
jgi:two-component sensor histidine kinase/FixJ family two-component response regulator